MGYLNQNNQEHNFLNNNPVINFNIQPHNLLHINNNYN